VLHGPEIASPTRLLRLEFSVGVCDFYACVCLPGMRVIYHIFQSNVDVCSDITVEHNPFIKSQLASRNEIEGLMCRKFGHVSPKILGGRKLGTPPCGRTTWSSSGTWRRTWHVSTSWKATRGGSRASPSPPAGVNPARYTHTHIYTHTYIYIYIYIYIDR
jgi:hypothetical protein